MKNQEEFSGALPLSQRGWIGLRHTDWRPWRELALFSLLVMELCWLVPWYRSLTPATYAAHSGWVFLVLGSIILFVHLVVRFMNYIHLRIDLRRWVLAVVLVICVFLGLKTLLYSNQTLSLFELVSRPIRSFSDLTSLIPDEFLVGLVILFACWRGISLAQTMVGPQAIIRNFQIGIFMFLGFVFINTIVTGETPGGFIYIFFFAGLIAMVSARITVLGNLRGGGRSPFDSRWFLGMLSTALGVVGLAALIARVSSGKLNFIVLIGETIFQVLATIMILLISPLLYLLINLTQNVPGIPESITNLVDTLSGLGAFLGSKAIEFGGHLPWLPNLKPILFWSIIVAVALLVLSALTLWILRSQDQRVEDRQFMMSGGDIWHLLRAAVKKQLKKFGEDLAGLLRIKQGQRLLAAARIRRIYIQLMELCGDLGKSRPAALTPLEFLPVLMDLFPGFENDLKTITQAYLRVRYGELPETRREVDQVESAWAQINAHGQELLDKQK